MSIPIFSICGIVIFGGSLLLWTPFHLMSIINVLKAKYARDLPPQEREREIKECKDQLGHSLLVESVLVILLILTAVLPYIYLEFLY